MTRRRRALMLRPSLCPHHAMVFRSRGRSYRELPLRIAELGGMYRAERSGVARRAEPGAGHLAQRRARLLRRGPGRRRGRRGAGADARRRTPTLGFARVTATGCRCAGRRGQVRSERTRPMWARAEALLRDGLDRPGCRTRRRPARPRSTDRRSTSRYATTPAGSRPCPPCRSTSPSRSASTCRTWTPDGVAAGPVMVHRSIVGSMERLFAHLIEVHDGAFPAWYAPVQVAVLPVAAQDPAFACQRAGIFQRAASTPACGSRCRSERIAGPRIRQAAERKVPYVAVIGAREAASDHRSRCGCATAGNCPRCRSRRHSRLIGEVVARRSFDLSG